MRKYSNRFANRALRLLFTCTSQSCIFSTIMPSNDTPAFFIIPCMGHSASAWLAQMLNEHPDIVCSHAYERPPFSIVSDPATRAINESSTPAQAQERLDNGARRVQTLPLDVMFQELICYAEARAYGNVHMHTIRSLRASADKYPPSLPIKAASLIRHPVSWIDSRAGNFVARMSRSSNAVAQEIRTTIAIHKAELGPLVAAFDLDVADPKIAAFLAAVAQLGGLVADIAAWPEIWLVKMEELTGDPAYFARFVHAITSGAVTADPSYIESVFATGKRNVHSPNSGLGLEERYNAWSEWQRRAYGAMAQKKRIHDVYSKLGYDFSFVR